jgi:hypothetical protein
MAPRRHRRRRLRRAVRGAQARPGSRGRSHAHRPAQLPPLPAAALPGRHGRPLAGRHRPAAPRHPAPQREHARRSRRGRRARSGRAPCRAQRRRHGRLRHAPRRDRGAARLLRPRRMGRAGAGAQDHRGRHGHPAPDPDRVRSRGTRGGPGSARGVDDVRGGGRRPDRRGAGRSARRDLARHAAPRLPLDPPGRRPSAPGRSARSRSADVPRGLSRSARRQLERLGVTVRTGTKVTEIDEERHRRGRPERRRERTSGSHTDGPLGGGRAGVELRAQGRRGARRRGGSGRPRAGRRRPPCRATPRC